MTTPSIGTARAIFAALQEAVRQARAAADQTTGALDPAHVRRARIIPWSEEIDQAVRLPDQAAAAHREAARLIEETIHTPPF